MKVSKKEYRVVEKVLQYWEQEGLADADQCQQLQGALERKAFDWQRLARYAFWGGIGCLVFALWAVFVDDKLIALLKHVFNMPPMIKAAFFVMLAAVLWWWGISIRRKAPHGIFTYDPVFFLGVGSVAISMLFLGQALDTSSGHYSLLILLAASIYLVAGWSMESGLIWLCALVAFALWFGAETGYQSDWGSCFLGMSYALRYVVFGVGILVASYLFRTRNTGIYLTTKAFGLLCLFCALWLTTLQSNGDEVLGRSELLLWAGLLFLVSVLAIFVGLKTNDDVMRGFGLVFIFINFYTRYFEYLLDEMHLALFFTLLAASFWLVGRFAERLWLLGK